MPPLPRPAEIPRKPDGVTPQTAPAQDTQAIEARPGDVPATTTNNPTSITPLAPAAQPAAAAFPAPTASAPVVQPPPTKTTEHKYDSGPPPPQPGAVPVAPPQTSAAPTAASGSKSPYPSEPPAQISLPPPVASSLQTHSTSTDPSLHVRTSPMAGPTPLNLGPVGSPQHGRPPGYVQNPFAADMTPQQRAGAEMLDVQEASQTRRGSGLGSILPSPVADGLGSLGRSVGIGLDGTGSPAAGRGVWETVKEMATSAGTKVVEAEEEVWKRFTK